MNKYMSGSELRQYLHISTRKMKYLMDNDYIPHENTGQATHKYRIRRADAKGRVHGMINFARVRFRNFPTMLITQKFEKQVLSIKNNQCHKNDRLITGRL